jgi:hypothetical protein
MYRLRRPGWPELIVGGTAFLAASMLKNTAGGHNSTPKRIETQ